MVTQFLYFL